MDILEVGVEWNENRAGRRRNGDILVMWRDRENYLGLAGCDEFDMFFYT